MKPEKKPVTSLKREEVEEVSGYVVRRSSAGVHVTRKLVRN